MTKEQRDAFVAKCEAAWYARAKAQELKPGMKWMRAELEFFMGVITAVNILDETPREKDTLSANIPVVWIINAMAGRSIATPEKEEK